MMMNVRAVACRILANDSVMQRDALAKVRRALSGNVVIRSIAIQFRN